MVNIEKIFIFPALVSATIAFAMTPLAIKLAWKLGLIDDPKKSKHPKIIHTKPIPRGGGLTIFIALLTSSLVFLPLDKHLAGILAGALVLLIMGLVDDKKSLNPYLRLGIQFVAASMPVAVGIGIAFWKPPFSPIIDLSSLWILADIFAVFWIVTIINFLNMGAKGIDGQLSGVVVIAAVVIAVLSLRFSADITEWPVIILAAITAGAYSGFLPWHIYPQKIMPGFSGSNMGGYLLAILSILTTAKVGALALVLGVPLIDTGYTIIRRVSQGKSPVWGDGGHLHHKLLDNGWSKPKVTYFYWTITGLLGLAALTLNAESKFYAIVGLVFLIGGILLWLTYRPKLR